MDEHAKEVEKLTTLSKNMQKMRNNLILSTIKLNRRKVSPFYVKREVPTNSFANKSNVLNTNNRQLRQEKIENKGRIAKKRHIDAVDEVSSETASKRVKTNVSKTSHKSKYRIVRSTSKLRIKVSKYSPLKHYVHKLPTIPEEE